MRDTNSKMSNPEIYEPDVISQMRSLPVRGIDYCVHEWGDPESPLLVYLHGWADTGSTFQFVVDALSKDWFVVAPDWRGFGRTEVSAEGYWFPDYLADLHELLNHYSRNEPVRLIGHSMGANIASLYAGAMPERVQTVINVEGFGLKDSDPNDAPQRYRDWIEAGQTRPVFAEYANFTALAKRIEKRSPKTGAAKAEFVARAWARKDDDDVVRLRADPAHKIPNAVLYRRAEAAACWRNISADILLISGDKSPFAELFDSTVLLPFPKSQSSVIEGAGHMIHFEAELELARTIENYLR